MEQLYVCTDQNCWCLLTFDSIATHISVKHSSTTPLSLKEKENVHNLRGRVFETRKSTGLFSNRQSLIDTSNKTLKLAGTANMNPQCSKIQAFSEVQTSMACFLTSTNQLYDNEISKLENTRASFEQDRENQAEIIRACKEKLFTLLLDFIAEFEKVLNKRSEYSRIFTNCSSILEKMIYEKKELEALIAKFKNKEAILKKEELDKILQLFSTNKFNLTQTELFAEVDDLMKKVKEYRSAQQVRVDNSQLLAIYQELSKYMKLGGKNNDFIELTAKKEFDSLFDQSQPWPNAFENLSESFQDITLFSNKNSIAFPMGKFENALHILEEDSNKLHLFTIDSDTMQVASRVEALDLEFFVPTKHRSLRTQDGNIVLTGGIEATSNNALNNCYQLLASGMKVNEIVPMRKRRHSHGMVELGNYLYVMGGICENDSIAFCERLHLDDLNGQWQEIAELNLPSYDATYCVFNESTIYKIGGFIGKGRMSNKIEKYSLRENHWYMVNYSLDQSNITLFAQSGAAQITEDRILIFGGRDANNITQKKTYSLMINKKFNGDTSYHLSSMEDAPMLAAEFFNSNQTFCQDKQIYCLVLSKEFCSTHNDGKTAYQIMNFTKNQWRHI